MLANRLCCRVPVCVHPTGFVDQFAVPHEIGGTLGRGEVQHVEMNADAVAVPGGLHVEVVVLRGICGRIVPGNALLAIDGDKAV